MAQGMLEFLDSRDLIVSFDFPNYGRSPLGDHIMLSLFISFYKKS